VGKLRLLMSEVPRAQESSSGYDVAIALGLGCTAAFVSVALRCGTGLSVLWELPACAPLDRWGLVPAAVWLDHAWWQVVSAVFVHGSGLHLAFNLWSLLVVAPWIQRVWGRAATLWIFFASGVGGCLASLAWAEAALVVGASGGVLGLAGALWVARRAGSARVREQLSPVSARVLGSSIVLLVALGSFVPVVAQAGHLGGLAVGSAIGVVLARSPRRPMLASFLVGSGLLFGGALAAHAPAWRPGYHSLRGLWWLERGEPARAVAALEEAHRRSPDDPDLANALGYALAESLQRLDEAERLAEHALALGGRQPHYLDTLGWIRCLRGDLVGGLPPLWEAVAGAPQDPVMSEHLAACPVVALRP